MGRQSVEVGRKVVMVSELDVTGKDNEYQQALKKDYEGVKRHYLVNVEGEWKLFRYAL